MSKRPAGEHEDGAGGKRIHWADETIHGPEHLILVRRMEEMERNIRALNESIKEKDAFIDQLQENFMFTLSKSRRSWACMRMQDLNEENKDLHKRIKENAVNTKDMGVQAELPPFDAVPLLAPDAAPLPAPDAPLPPSQAAPDVEQLSPPPPQVPAQARQRRVPDLRRARDDPPYKFFKNKKRRNNPVPLDDIDMDIFNTIIRDINTLWEELTNRDPEAPRIPLAVFRRVTAQFVGDRSYPYFEIEQLPPLESPDTNETNINTIRRIFEMAQRVAEYEGRKQVSDKHVLIGINTIAR